MILIPVILFLVGLPFLLLMGLLPWLLRVAGVVLLIKALLDKPTRWENFMPAVVAFALSLLIGWIFERRAAPTRPAARPAGPPRSR